MFQGFITPIGVEDEISLYVTELIRKRVLISEVTLMEALATEKVRLIQLESHRDDLFCIHAFLAKLIIHPLLQVVN